MTSEPPPAPRWARTRGALAVLCVASATARVAAQEERAVLLVDPADADALYVANVYAAARRIPASNVLYMAPDAQSFEQFAAENLPALFGTLAARGLDEHVDYVIVAPGTRYHINAFGLVSDPCIAVKRLAISSGYTLAYQADEILAGVPSRTPNQFSKEDWNAQRFSSRTSWLGGEPSAAPGARRYFIGALLGYTGENGNTVDEIVSMIERSVAADGSRPAGTFYYMQTANIRSSIRDGAFDDAVSQLAQVGAAGQHLLGVLPSGAHDCLGVMTGAATPDIDGTPMTLAPGAFADHLTSFAANFDSADQTKLSRWIVKGASASCGAVEEPCANPGKFPHARLHVLYRQGLTLGEAWLRSVALAPFQTLLYGDPLTRPWSRPPSVSVQGVPAAPVAGIVALLPQASAAAPGALVASHRLFVDGLLVQEVGPGQPFGFDTRRVADGWHELRVVTRDTTAAGNEGRWIGALEVRNRGRGITVAATPAAGDLSTRFAFAVTAEGAGVEEVRLLQNGRVVAALPSATATLRVHGQILGAGPVRVQAEALYSDGGRAVSAPVSLDVSFATGAPNGALPQTFEHVVLVAPDRPFVVALPATFDLDPASVRYSVLVPPARATILNRSNVVGPYRVLRPNPGATGEDTLVYAVNPGGGSTVTGTVRLRYLDAPAVPARATFRGDRQGLNRRGFSALPPALGLPWHAEVDNTGTGDQLAGIVAYERAAEIFRAGAGGWVLVDAFGPHGELAGLRPLFGTGAVRFQSPSLPIELALVGFRCSLQGYGAGLAGLTLHNAVDVTFGF